MSSALLSSCQRSTPWRAAVGSAWCRLCQDSPIEITARGQTLRDWSRVWNGLSPKAWQIELIDHVTWCSTATRTRLPQKKAVAAPYQKPSPTVAAQAPPATAGRVRLSTTHRGKSRLTRCTAVSASRSGAKRCWSVCSTSNSQPTWACHRPLHSAQKVVP